jgi:hypothetical protein
MRFTSRETSSFAIRRAYSVASAMAVFIVEAIALFVETNRFVCKSSLYRISYCSGSWIGYRYFFANYNCF